MKNLNILVLIIAVTVLSQGCETVGNPGKNLENQENVKIEPGALAEILSEIPFGLEQMEEVYDAVSSSCSNGYDDEYMIRSLFLSPGSGVGDSGTKAGEKAKQYSKPFKELFSEYFSSVATKAGGPSFSVEDYVKALTCSDMQIYWPYYEGWDRNQLPLITFDPADGSTKNIGYRIKTDSQGNREVEEVIVDEEMAKNCPVWVINRNDDSGYTSLELLRRQDPDWGSGGGDIIIGKKGRSFPASENSSYSSSESSSDFKTLILKNFTMHRNYDPWFAGASEFFVKCGSVEDFTASTEAELALYNPSITDFMIVVKRSQVGKPRPFNAVLVSQWTGQLESCALMIIEDDGGTRTSWKCEASTKIKSRTYGFDINIPFNSKDDIVWRGQLSGKYFEKYSGETGNFGDVSLTFSLVSP